VVGTAFGSQSLAEGTNAVIHALSAIYIGGKRVMPKYIPSPSRRSGPVDARAVLTHSMSKTVGSETRAVIFASKPLQTHH
jgi:hypothetical protein